MKQKVHNASDFEMKIFFVLSDFEEKINNASDFELNFFFKKKTIFKETTHSKYQVLINFNPQKQQILHLVCIFKLHYSEGKPF